MKIKLEFPYTEKYRLGYLGKNTENRRVVFLVKHHETKASCCTTYARYLLGVKYKRFLTKNEEADHVNEDKTNDDLCNLQILSVRENKVKSSKKPQMVDLECPWCHVIFIRKRRNTHIVKGGRSTCCSRSCAGKYQHIS